MQHIAVHIPTSDMPLQELLIALLADAGYEGFEQETDALVAYIPETGFNEIFLRSLLSGHDLSFHIETIAPQNWNAQWESSFQPVLINDFCAIRASFHPPVKNIRYEIIITPKMSFGTGHHATTSSMISLMQKMDFNNKKVLDFGTGTGVLAILAYKMGSRDILAIDNNSSAIENAQENIIENNATGIKISLSGQLPIEETYDVILANINRNTILEHLGMISRSLQPGGQLLLSGILAADEPIIITSAKANGLSMLHRILSNNWLALQMKKEARSGDTLPAK